jgi:gliding motility-associated-like protein
MRAALLFFLLINCCRVNAQYTLNGNAALDNCHCYTLTPDDFDKSGSVWNNFKIDLTQSFDFNFDIFPGCSDAGADGMVFVLQPISTSVGTAGGGLGFQGVTPSVGVTLDTYQNSGDNDPSFDHIAIQLNGNTSHADPVVNIAGPVTILAGVDNAEDCNWHTLRVQWDAPTKKLSAYIDGNLRLSVIKDFVNHVFSGSPEVFWGFTGSTGGEKNLQRFCTALTPKFTFSAGQKRCFGEPVTFFDSTISFTAVQKLYWDFGDNSPIDSVNHNPVHTYINPGDYTMKQTAIGADGCVETNTTIVRIGSKPVAAFENDDNCVAKNIQFTDTSKATVGTINKWYWDFDNGTFSNSTSPSTQYLTNGAKNIKLAVTSLEGCASDTLVKPIYIYKRPVLDFSFNDSVCLGSSVSLTSNVISSDGPIQGWIWNFGDTVLNTANAFYNFQTAGNHTVLLGASSTGGASCLGMVQKNVFIRSKPVAAFKNNFVCQAETTSLIDSSYNPDGTPVNRWRWDIGNGKFSNSQNPLVTFSTGNNFTIQLAVQSGNCVSDTLTRQLIIEPKPLAEFNYSNAKCPGQPVLFTDLSSLSTGVINQWAWLYNTDEWSTDKEPARAFVSGNHTIGLKVASEKGCTSDTVFKTVAISPVPEISMSFADACANTSVNFTATDITGNAVAQWHWNFGDGAGSDSGTLQHIYSAAGNYPIQLFGLAQNGCSSDTLKMDILIYSTNAFAGNDLDAAVNQPIQLQATGGVLYQWSPASGLSNSTIPNPLATNSSNQTYYLKVFTPAGCESYDTINIRVFQLPEIYVPSAFSPDGNGINDLLRAIPVGITQFKNFTVFNRLGQAVFSTSDASKGWDGYFKGKLQDLGAYIWIASGISFRGASVIRKGTVMLIK